MNAQLRPVALTENELKAAIYFGVGQASEGSSRGRNVAYELAFAGYIHEAGDRARGEPREAGVDDIADAGHGQRGLRDVGGEDDAAAVRARKDPLLILHRESREQRQDLGARLQTAGHLTALRRTAIGTIGIEQCAELGQDPPPVVSAEKVIGDVMPTLQPDADGIDALRNGRRLSLDVPDSTYLVVDSGGSWVSVVSVRDGASHIEVNAPS